MEGIARGRNVDRLDCPFGDHGVHRDTWNITRCLLITWYLPNIGMLFFRDWSGNNASNTDLQPRRLASTVLLPTLSLQGLY